ncbi:hypothetical protein HIM_08532 [Hirsutella minnesotensis 3608]|uniref:Fatty acyl-CoA reductase n=1 Tax=Hirsutella minnesotensis 3608 TaxID=1043627 RepID=A0A0F7ZY94_9HYPO|nr:hypothetical protein HIM_08532 [Hirsutella minnesotensis 3608]
MLDSLEDNIVDFYKGRHVFCTGATGMLGMAYLSRLVLDTRVDCVYAAVRGGEGRLWEIWRNHLPSAMVKALRLSGKLVIWEGDITRPGCGLTTDQVALVHEKVSIFIHGASTINLQKSLDHVAQQIIYPSVALAEMALACANLVKFVYISTAYANAFIPKACDAAWVGCEAAIAEDINYIRSGCWATASMELSDLKAYGSTPEYEFVQHPFPYSYAKHLTERLLLEAFNKAQRDSALLIFRPSCIGPAESWPYPFYEVPGSCTTTAALAAFIANPPTTMRFSSYLLDTSAATIDEVPVDIVVNRLVAHVAFESSGCVHAVGGSKGRHRIEDVFHIASRLRRFWWGRPKLVWCREDWKSPRLCTLARLFTIAGCSFVFEESKTERIWDRMSGAERSVWPLWSCQDIPVLDNLVGREKACMALIMGPPFLEEKAAGIDFVETIGTESKQAPFRDRIGIGNDYAHGTALLRTPSHGRRVAGPSKSGS